MLRSGWLTYGPKVREFGEACGRYLDVPHAVPVASASAGLLVGLKALGVRPGDEVVLPALTFIATLGAVVHCGARPVLADIDPVNLGLDPEALAAAITPRTKVIIAVHLARPSLPPRGNPGAGPAARHQGPRGCGSRFGAEVARAPHLGGSAMPRSSPSTPPSASPPGTAGLVTCTDPELADTVRLLSFHGMDGNAWQRYGDKGRWYYEIVALGYKFHLGDPAAALGLVQLSRADDFLARRTAMAARFTAAFAGLPGVTAAHRGGRLVRHAWHLYILQVDPRGAWPAAGTR